MRYLAIDHGTRRIGLAVGDAETRLAAPVLGLTSHASAEENVRAVIAAAADFGANAFVLGLPLNMDGSEGPQARLVREFGELLKRRSGLAVHYMDERLSTDSAREKLLQGDYTRKRKRARLDGLAAQIILQDFLDSLPADPHTSH